jgi:hypothetical protein
MVLTSRFAAVYDRIELAALAKVFYYWRRERPLGLPV